MQSFDLTLDKDALCNYRPVSNLPQLSKVIEKVILQRLTRGEDESMFDPYHAAYRAKHSTETALLFVVNQIKMAFDNRKGTVLVFIDFSSAFDTIIDHAILLRRLRLRYGLEGKALDLIASYLHGRTQRVVIGEQSSSSSILMSGVP